MFSREGREVGVGVEREVSQENRTLSFSLSSLVLPLSLSISISLPLSSLRTEQAFAQADDGAIGGGRGAESG